METGRSPELVVQPVQLIDAFWAQYETLSQKIRCRVIEEDIGYPSLTSTHYTKIVRNKIKWVSTPNSNTKAGINPTPPNYKERGSPLLM